MRLVNDAHEAEARARWGNTEAYQQSASRTSGYGAADWEALKAEAAAYLDVLVGCMAAGEPPECVTAMDAAEAHRAHIEEWFYACDHAMQVALADMYVADGRFKEHYDAVRPGLAAYLRDAIRANAARQTQP